MTFPEAGPTSRQMIDDHLTGGTGLPAADTTRVERIADAVNSWVRTLPVASPVDAASPVDWTGYAHIVEGATMLGARLYRRKNTPDGVAVFSGEGIAYVRRTDPDIAQLLALGDYAPPQVG